MKGAAKGVRVQVVDRARFESEVQPLLPRLHRLCLALCRSRQEAEDLLQDTLVRAYLRRDHFQGKGSFFGWLCSITRNQFIENRRMLARRRSLLESALEGALAVIGSPFKGGGDPLDPEAQVCRSQQAEMLLRCLHSLPEKYRLVVLLCDVEEMSYEEVADVLGTPLGTIKSRHFRGRAQLSEAFQALQEDVCEQERRQKPSPAS